MDDKDRIKVSNNDATSTPSTFPMLINIQFFIKKKGVTNSV